MSEEVDAEVGQRRSMVCEPGTATVIARALAAHHLRRPGIVAVLLVLGIVVSVPLALNGQLVGAVVQGVAFVVVVAALIATTSYRQVLRAARTLYPGGATVTVDITDDCLVVRNGAGSQRSRYSAFSPPVVARGCVLLPLRMVRARVILPPGLLTPSDVAWLADRIHASAAQAGEPVRPDHTAAVAGPNDLVTEVVVTEEMAARAPRALLRYRLRGRGALCVLLLSLGVGLEAFAVTGSWWAAATVGLACAVALVLFVRARVVRSLRRTSGVGRTVRARFDDTHLHLHTDGGGSGSLAYSAIRRVVVLRGVVLLVTATRLVQVLPVELFPDEALRRLGAGEPAAA